MLSSLKANKFARAACLVATLSLTALATGCTQEELDGAMAGAGIALIGVAIIDGAGSSSGGHYECVGQERTVCQDSRDYYGHSNRVCRTQYDSCADRRYVGDYRDEGRYHRMMATGALSSIDYDMGDLTPPTVAAADSGVSDVSVAQTFGLSFDAAHTILDSLKQAQAGNTQALAALGLSAEDRQALAALKLPADSGIDSMARTLNQDPQTVKAMLSRLVDLAQKQQAARAGVANYMTF